MGEDFQETLRILAYHLLEKSVTCILLSAYARVGIHSIVFISASLGISSRAMCGKDKRSGLYNSELAQLSPVGLY